jgi:hypothetical protein
MLHVTGTTQCEMFAQAPSRIRVSSSKFDSRGRKVRGSRTYSNTIAFVAE